MKRRKAFDNDQWLTKHFKELVDKYAGGFIVAVNGRIVYTDKDGSPRELGERVREEFPGATPLFFRVPFPHEFVCALTTL